MNSKEMNNLRRRNADSERKSKGLLTGKEIKATRKRLGFSMRAFADYICVGEASVKRWETYYVQEESMDRLMRLMSDEVFVARHLRLLRKRIKDREKE